MTVRNMLGIPSRFLCGARSVLLGAGASTIVFFRNGREAMRQMRTAALFVAGAVVISIAGGYAFARAQAMQQFPAPLSALFTPSGYMGDGEAGPPHLVVADILAEGLEEAVPGVRVTCNRRSNGWTGVYWQYPPNNWGEEPGRDLSGASAITFSARGVSGGEIVEFKAGGIRGGRYEDSFEVSLGKIALDTSWRGLEIDLSSQDLSNVIGGFAIVATLGPSDSTMSFEIARMQIR